jgi:hypothetical protein
VPAETVRRLLTAGRGNPTLDTVLSMLRPLGLGLTLVELADAGEGAPADPDLVRVWLAHYGAPLYGATAAKAEEVPRAEYVLAEALKLARQDATVARALSVALYRNRERLDLAEPATPPSLARRARSAHAGRGRGRRSSSRYARALSAAWPRRRRRPWRVDATFA